MVETQAFQLVLHVTARKVAWESNYSMRLIYRCISALEKILSKTNSILLFPLLPSDTRNNLKENVLINIKKCLSAGMFIF